MDVLISREAVNKMIEHAVFLGQIEYMTMITPEEDRIRKAEAVRYLKRRGYSPKVLDDWVQMKFIHRRKYGEKNSPVYYSLKEIQRQILATETMKGNIREYIPDKMFVKNKNQK